MPWRETEVVDERVGFIAAVQQDPSGNFTRLCERFGISRETGYKWVERYRQQGPEGLRDRRPVPASCPHRTADAVETRVVELRKQWPY
jgi:transposase-like protein